MGPPPERAKAVIVGETPGMTEMRRGIPFIGKSGYLIRTILNGVGFNVPNTPELTEAIKNDELQAYMTAGDVYITNAALCTPPPSEADTYKTSDRKRLAAKCCVGRLRDEVMPYVNAGIPIAALGGSSSMVLAGNDAITKIRGKWHKGNRVITTWHPAYILRQPSRFSDLANDMKNLWYGKPRYLDFPQVSVLLIDTMPKLREFTDELIRMAKARELYGNGRTACIDIETDNIDWRNDQILCIQFSWNVWSGAVIADSLIYEDETRECLTRLFDPDNEIEWVGHNVKFDLRFLRHQLHVDNAWAAYDSLLADYVLDENKMHALKEVLAQTYGLPDYEQDLVLRYLKSKNDRYSKVPRLQLYEYGVMDTAYTLRLWGELREQLEDQGLFDRPFMFPTMAAQTPYLEIELHGMRISRERLADLSRRLRGHLNELKGLMMEIVPGDFNPNSYLQVGRIMYDVLKMPKYKAKTKAGWSTNKEMRGKIEAHFVEQGYRPNEHPPFKWLTLYNQWKTIEKLRNSYVDNTIPLIDANERVHPDILGYGTETGRASVRDPALQTIPRTGTGEALGEVWGKAIKQCYVAPDGCVIVQVDYSQAELRTGAWMSQDPFLINAYHDGVDIHGSVANDWFPGWDEMGPDDTMVVPGVGELLDKKTLRVAAKKGVFARFYLGTEYAIAGILGCSPKQARPYLLALDRRLAGLVAWEHEQFKLMSTQGYVETLTGRRRRVPLITRDNMDDARKAACNAPVQGTAADLTTISMIEVFWWIKEQRRLRPDDGWDRVHILITVHDSVILESPKPLAREVALKTKEFMERVASDMMPGIPWKADIEIGYSWGDLKEWSPSV